MGKVLISIIALTIGLSVLLTGCNSGGCTELRSAVPRADFYSSSTLNAISVDSLQITGIGAPGDSVLYGPSQRLSTAYLPMPADVDRVKWRFEYMQKHLALYSISDTLSIKFDRTPWFAGEECGAMYKYRITQVDCTRNLIDSIAIVDSLVINVEQATFNIYFRTEEP